MEISQKTKIELPYDLIIPLLGICPEKTIIKKGTCTPVFIAALFEIAKTQKQPKCSSTDKWIKKMWRIYTREYCSAIKKSDIMPFAATWARYYHTKWSKSDRERLCDITYVLSCSVFAALWPTRATVHEDSPGKNTGVGCHALLQGYRLYVEYKIRHKWTYLWNKTDSQN